MATCKQCMYVYGRCPPASQSSSLPNELVPRGPLLTAACFSFFRSSNEVDMKLRNQQLLYTVTQSQIEKH